MFVKLECVFDPADGCDLAGFCGFDGDDVEPGPELGRVGLQISFGGGAQLGLFGGRDGFEAGYPCVLRTELDFNEEEIALVLSDEINLAQAGAEVADDDVKAVLLQMGGSDIFAEDTSGRFVVWIIIHHS